MNTKFFFAALLACCFLGIVSCGDDNDNGNAPCSVAWATDLQNEINAISAAAQAYALDPTTANCNAYKDAYQDYIDALEPYGNCTSLTGQARQDWQDALDAAKANINSLC